MKSAQVSAIKYHSMLYNFPFPVNGSMESIVVALVLPIFRILFDTMRSNRKWKKIKKFNQWLHSVANVHIAIIFMRQSVHNNNNGNIWTENTNSFFIGLSAEHSTVYRLIIIYQLKMQDWIRIFVNKIRKMLFYFERNMRHWRWTRWYIYRILSSELPNISHSHSHSPKHLSILKLVSSFDKKKRWMHHTLNTCYVHKFVVSGARWEEEEEFWKNITKKFWMALWSQIHALIGRQKTAFAIRVQIRL